MYPAFLNDGFFYSDNFDEDIGNKLMKRQHSEMILQRLISLEFVSFQLMSVIYAIL